MPKSRGMELPGHHRKLTEIERLRGVAVLMILCTHVRDTFNLPVIFRQWAGVDLFFVISGFVIAKSLTRILPDLPQGTFVERLEASWLSLKVFFLRRVCRIYPAAIVAFGLTLACSLVFKNSPHFGSFREGLIEFLGVMSGFYNYLYASGFLGNRGWYWSLAVEEQFYLMLPFVFIFLPRRNDRLLFCILGILLVAFLFRPFMNIDHNWLYERFTSHRKFDAPLAGVLLALLPLPKTRNDRPSPWIKYGLVPGLIFYLCAITAYLFHPTFGEQLRHPLLGITVIFCSTWLVLLASRDQGSVLKFSFVGRCLELVGARSFSLYLVHPTAIRIWLQLCDEHAALDFPRNTLLGLGGHFLVCLFLSFAITECLHRWCEKPWIAYSAKKVTAWSKQDQIPFQPSKAA